MITFAIYSLANTHPSNITSLCSCVMESYLDITVSHDVEIEKELQ